MESVRCAWRCSLRIRVTIAIGTTILNPCRSGFRPVASVIGGRVTKRQERVSTNDATSLVSTSRPRHEPREKIHRAGWRRRPGSPCPRCRSWCKTALATQVRLAFDASRQIEEGLSRLLRAAKLQLLPYNATFREPGSPGFLLQPLNQLLGQSNGNCVTHV